MPPQCDPNALHNRTSPILTRDPRKLINDIREQIKFASNKSQERLLRDQITEIVQHAEQSEWHCDCGHSGHSHIPRGGCKYCKAPNKVCRVFKIGKYPAWDLKKMVKID